MAQNASMRLLYAEDNRLNALLFQELLRGQPDIELRIAEDGSEALRIAREWLPQVLVLDAQLPDMSGFELLPRLRSLPELAGAPAYMCSAEATQAHVARSREAGFDGYWAKPLDIAEVTATLLTLARSRPAD
jgi:CheY-like chemotaxis protein